MKVDIPQIRTITFSYGEYFYIEEDLLILKSLYDDFSEELYSITSLRPRTARISLPQLEHLNEDLSINLVESLTNFSTRITETGFRWFNLPISLNKLSHYKDLPDFIRTLLIKCPNIFINLVLDSVDESVLSLASKSIIKASRILKNGLDCFRIGISTGNLKNCPYFPYANFDKSNLFSIGLETIPLITNIDSVDFVSKSEVVEIFGDQLKKGINFLNKGIIFDLEKKYENLKFIGFDASISPFPRSEMSIIKVLNKMGINNFGTPGTLSCISLLTDKIKNCLDESNIPRVGFNGVMLSITEDDGLADCGISQYFSLDSLMLYSTVCGCGLDMIPVPGDIHSGTIENIIEDTYTLSKKHSKPLGIRLLPQPGLQANDLSNLNHDFLVDTRILKVRDSRRVT